MLIQFIYIKYVILKINIIFQSWFSERRIWYC